MAELFKNIFNKKFFEEFTGRMKTIAPGFNATTFTKQIFTKEWEDKELKERMRHITLVLKNQLPADFKQSSALIVDFVKQLRSEGVKEKSVEYMFLPDFIEVGGIDDFKTSMKAMETITQFTSCEFAIRPFLIKYPEKGMQQMYKWSKHKVAMVRRLSTEGCRPRLPWAMALPVLKKDPSVILPILERLKNDDSESVRRSVANNLNDISKDNPAVTLRLAKEWQGISKETDWLVKHACRTLLKQGNPKAMQLFGYSSVKNILVEDFKILTPKLWVGGALEFSFQLKNNKNTIAKIRLEYAVYYQKANGTLSKKVYKISEKDYPRKSSVTVERKQSFRLITTRKFHPGLHQVAVIINGNEFERYDFELVK